MILESSKILRKFLGISYKGFNLSEPMQYYADSCIWIDFLEDRYPVNLFEECLTNKEELLISDVLMGELYRYGILDNMKMILQMFESENLLCKAMSTNKQISEAKTKHSHLSIRPNSQASSDLPQILT